MVVTTVILLLSARSLGSLDFSHLETLPTNGRACVMFGVACGMGQLAHQSGFRVQGRPLALDPNMARSDSIVSRNENMVQRVHVPKN